MSKFWYFLGGCAAGALAVAAVQAFTEDSYSSSSRTSSFDDDADSADSPAAEPLLAEDCPENREATAQGMETVLSSTGNQANIPPDIQEMGAQLATSVMGIVAEFLRQSQAMTHGQQPTAATSAGDDADMNPITPAFGAAQA